VERGELVCLLGPSGCGKSTLLRIISGLTAADGGAIHIAGADMTRVPANRRPTAMVFQSHALWSHMTVAQNVGFEKKSEKNAHLSEVHGYEKAASGAYEKPQM
jgi:putative spermidine/putrescine transport system ATP-binding protein